MTMMVDDPRHGTHNGYNNLKCRCDRCRRANTEYHWLRCTGGYATDTCPGCGGAKRACAKQCRECWTRETRSICGEPASYRNGCRCDLCVAAVRAKWKRDKRESRRRLGVTA